MASTFAAEATMAAARARKAADVAGRELGNSRRPLEQSSPRAAKQKMPTLPINTPRSSTKAVHIPSLGEIDRAGRTALEARRMVDKMLDRLESATVSEGIQAALDLLPTPDAGAGTAAAAMNSTAGSTKKKTLTSRPTPRGGVKAAAGRAVSSSSPRSLKKPTLPAVDNPKFDALLSSTQDELKRRDAALGPDHPGTLERLHTLGALLAAQGRFDEAEEHLARALKAREATLGASHAKTQQTSDVLDNVRRKKAGDWRVTLSLDYDWSSAKKGQSPRIKFSYD